ncbi:MAG: efflux RND transporter periplasmic adaptor subunit [Alphaproteobacteria bacterium]|nr:efflux RND transporter periplasmic adaptor subunit [Alphaproteobacteria bacterium]
MAGQTNTIGAGKVVALIAAGLIVSVFGISAWRADATLLQSETPPLPVAALSVVYEDDAQIDESYPGLISARRESALGFQQGGRIDRLAVDVGDRVVAGEVLGELDTRAVRAQVAAADAQTAEAAAQTALARETETRQASLLERGHISQQRFDEAATATAAAAARQNAARASADAMRVQLDLMAIEAPYDGVVTARLADEGSIAAPGQPIFQLVESDALEIRVGLPVDIAANLEEAQPYTFLRGDTGFTAVFRASTGVIDRQTRTVTAVFDLEAGSPAVAGDVARLVVSTPVGARGFWVPTSALSEGRRGLWSVFLLQPENGQYRLEARVVETVRVETDRAFVRGAVADGDYILSSGIHRVIPGQRVIPAIETEQAP